MCLNCVFWQIVTVEYWLSDLKPGLSQGLSAFLRANNENWSMVVVVVGAEVEVEEGRTNPNNCTTEFWSCLAIYLYYFALFFSPEMKKVFNRHCITGLKWREASKANLNAILFFLFISWSLCSHRYCIHIGQVCEQLTPWGMHHFQCNGISLLQ